MLVEESLKLVMATDIHSHVSPKEQRMCVARTVSLYLLTDIYLLKCDLIRFHQYLVTNYM